MADRRMNFVLQGRDQLSRVLDRAGDSATRMHRRLSAAATNSSSAINRFVTDASQRMSDLGDSSNEPGKAMEALRKSVLSLAPAIIPVAAAMAPLVASTAAAGAAVGVYTAALGPQIAALGEASKAEQKYQDAVEESGAQSEAAVKAQAAYAAQMAKLPPATREAAAQLSVLKDSYKDWSNALADDTMAPVTKGLATMTALLPKLTPMVKGTSGELDRMVTILAGGMASPGFDRVLKQFTEFSTGVLSRANDALVRFMRTLDTGAVGGGVSDFMTYARANGPLVADTLKNVGQALANVLRAGADVGVGLLQAVNALAKLIAAVPAGAITVFLQLAIAVKAVRLAALGLAAARGAIAAFGVSIAAMHTAAAAAPGRLAAVSAAIGTLSRTAKLAIAGTGIGLLVIAISELAQIGKEAPADVDKLATSLGQFSKSGKLTGEAARVLGSDFKEFDEALRGLARPGQWDQIQQGFTDFFGQDSTPVKRWKEDIGAVDDALAQLVTSGNPQLAAQAHSLLAKRAQEEGLTTAELNTQLVAYKQALADAKFEQELAAQAMGLFGAQALLVQEKLNAQKAAADGLRQSINALNDANLIARGGVRGMEAAIDAATQSFKDNGATLDNNTEKGRANNAALDTLADATMRAAESARANGASWETVNGIYDRGRQKLIESADQMGLTREQAVRLANQILRTPDKTARLRGNMEDLQAKLGRAKRELRNVPDSRKAQVRANIYQLEQAIAKARGELNALDGKTAHTWVKTHYTTDSTGARRHGVQGTQLRAKGGLITGPGTGTSDSVPVWASNGEFMIRAAAVRKYGLARLNAINEGRAAGSSTRHAMSRPAAPVMRQSADSGRAETAALRARVAALEAAAGQQPVEVRVFISEEPIRGLARAEVRKANGELVQVLNAGGGM